MDGIQRITDYGKGFVTYHLYPITTGHMLFIVIYTIFSIYFYDYVFKYPLFKWMYLGSIIIFIGTIYGDGIQPAPPVFKIGQN